MNVQTVVLSSVSVVFVSECVHVSPWIILLNGFGLFFIALLFIGVELRENGGVSFCLSPFYTSFLSSASLQPSVFKGPACSCGEVIQTQTLMR